MSRAEWLKHLSQPAFDATMLLCQNVNQVGASPILKEPAVLRTYEGTVRHGQIRLSADAAFPEGARVHVTILPGVDEQSARRKANRWQAENVGDMVMADQGRMDQAGERRVRRFSAFVTALSREPFGSIGYVDIEVDTGVVLADSTIAEEIARRGERLERAPLLSSD